jgi:hypothetical protein
MVSKPARVRDRSVAALLLGIVLALVAVLPFAGSVAAQDASPEAVAEPSGLAALGLQEITVDAQAGVYSMTYPTPLVEGWTLVSLTSSGVGPAVVNFAKVPDGQTGGDLSSVVFSAFQGEGGTLPEWWANTEFAGGAWAGAGETTQTAIYLTPGKWVGFSTNPFSVQPIQTLVVATPEDAFTNYGVGEDPAAATPAAEASPVVEGLPADGTVNIGDGVFNLGSEPAAGPQIWAVTNDSAQVSEIVLVSVDYEIPAEEAILWVGTFAAGDLGNAVIENGSGLISPGSTAYVSLDLAPGTYVLYSTAPDAAGGLQSDIGLNVVFTIAG